MERKGRDSAGWGGGGGGGDALVPLVTPEEEIGLVLCPMPGCGVAEYQFRLTATLRGRLIFGPIRR